MTIAADIVTLQAVNRAVAGIKSAPDGTTTYPIPSSVTAAHLPIVLLFPGVTDVSAAGREVIDATRAYDGMVLVASEASGAGVNTSVTDCWDLIDAMRAAWADYILNPASTLVVDTYHDEGQRRITYRGGDWLGFTFKLSVWETA